MKRYLCVSDLDDRPDGDLFTDDLDEAVSWVRERATRYRETSDQWRAMILDTSRAVLVGNRLAWELVGYEDPSGSRPI